MPDSASPYADDSHYKAVFETVDSGVLLADSAESILDANPAACRMLARPREALVGLKLAEVFDPSYPFLETARQSGPDEIFKGGVRLLGGSGRPFAAEVSLVTRPDGGMILMLRDATVRTRTGEVLGGSAEVFEALVENGLDLITLCNPDNTIRYISPSVKRILGYETAELEGAFIPDFVHPDDLERATRESAAVLSNPDYYTSPFRYRRKDGSYAYLENVFSNLLEDPAVRGIVVNSRDVTDRVLAEKAVRVSERQLRTITEGAPVVLFALDAEGTVTLSEGRGLESLGLAPGEVVGRSIHELYERSPCILAQIRRAFAGEESSAVVEAGELVFETRCSPTRSESDGTGRVNGVIGVATDITARVKASRELERYEAHHRKVLELAPDAIITMDGEGKIHSFNRGAERTFGYAPREVLGRPLTMLMPEPFREPHTEGLRRYLETGEPRMMGRTVELAGLHKSGREFPLELSLGELRDEEEVLFTGILRDITERKELEAQLEHQAFNDPVTGLPNRVLFMDRLSHALVRSAPESGEDKGEAVAVLLLDLDHFKLINDSLGHSAGDELLAEVGKRLRASLWPRDTVARLGGDEFAILLEEVTEVEDASRTARWLLGSLGLPFRVDGTLHYVRASVGVASSGPGCESPTELLRNADIAMYRAKHAGGARHELYAPAMGEEATRRLELENELRHAVERDELRLYYQPIVDLATGKTRNLEALVRWEHPERGLMLPGEFIPIAEETGLILELGAWVLREACQQARAWRDSHPDDAPTVCVNVSPRQFRRPELAEEVTQALRDSGLEPGSLTIELTESALMEGAELTATVLRDLKALGVSVAIDDFGKGYSSLERLERLPIDLLKIDRSFIGKLQGGPTETAIVEAITGLGRGLGLEVVAEGIETAEQLDHARTLGCSTGQGYFFSRPTPPEEVGRLLAQRLMLSPGGAAFQSGRSGV